MLITSCVLSSVCLGSNHSVWRSQLGVPQRSNPPDRSSAPPCADDGFTPAHQTIGSNRSTEDCFTYNPCVNSAVRQRRRPSVDLVIRRLVRRLARQFDPDQIILFGSHARGDARPDSDIDLLVVMPLTKSRRDAELEMRLAVHDIKSPKDIFVVTPDEVARQRRIPGTIVRPALLEGKALYVRRA